MLKWEKFNIALIRRMSAEKDLSSVALFQYCLDTSDSRGGGFFFGDFKMAKLAGVFDVRAAANLF